jgi:hypothetical protein
VKNHIIGSFYVKLGREFESVFSTALLRKFVAEDV